MSIAFFLPRKSCIHLECIQILAHVVAESGATGVSVVDHVGLQGLLEVAPFVCNTESINLQYL